MKNELKIFVGDLQRHYDKLDIDQQEKLRVRAAQVLAIGTMTTFVGAFYGYLPLMVRLVAIPLATIGLWYFTGKLAKNTAALQIVIQRLKHAPMLAVLGSLMMVAFLLIGLLWGVR